MTLPPSQNQYPGWQPPSQPQPVQPPSPAQPAPISQPTIGGPAGPGPRKNIFKGPLIALVVLLVLMGIIVAVALLSSKKPAKTNTNTQSNTPNQSQPTNSQAKADATNDKTYDFIDAKQQSNLKNISTLITTKQSQDPQHKLVPASQKGWNELGTQNIIDPVTNHPYSFTTDKTPAVGQVQYVLQSVCSSDNDIIPSTLTSSFALRTQLYNGTYYCVDTSNAGN